MPKKTEPSSNKAATESADLSEAESLNAIPNGESIPQESTKNTFKRIAAVSEAITKPYQACNNAIDNNALLGLNTLDLYRNAQNSLSKELENTDLTFEERMLVHDKQLEIAEKSSKAMIKTSYTNVLLLLGITTIIVCGCAFYRKR